jgi:hypothetical protein
VQLEQVTTFDAFKESFLASKPEVVISDGWFPLNINEGALKDGWLLVIGFLKEQGFAGKLIIDSPAQIDVSPHQNLPFTVTRHDENNTITMQLLDYECQLDAEFAKTRIDKDRLNILTKTLEEIAKLTKKRELTTQISEDDKFWLAETYRGFSVYDNQVRFIGDDLLLLGKVYMILEQALEKLQPGELQDNVVRLSNELLAFLPDKAIEEQRAKLAAAKASREPY